MKKETLKRIIRDFHVTPLRSLHKRSLQVPLHSGKIITLVGVRRSGKTSYLLNLISELLAHGTPIEAILYINFEDERLNLTTDELDLLLQAYQELYPNQQLGESYFFFDEIQNVHGWDTFVRRIYDQQTKNIVLTGSNARFLSSDIATTLRGRTVTYEVYPLSFAEYLNFQNVTVDLYSSSSLATINYHLANYVKNGAFPEVIVYNDELRNRVLQEYFNVMIYRDLVERYDIRNLPALKFFLKRIIASATKQLSINNIYNELKSSGFRLGKNQLYEFLEATVNIYFAQVLKKYSTSLVDRELGERKVYIIDTGLLNAIDFKFSNDTGKLIEQVVFWELKRREHDIWFFKERSECDFLVRKGFEVTEAMQVCSSLSQQETRKRELRGLTECCRHVGLTSGTIITLDESDQFEHEGIAITVLPLAHWLLRE